MNPFAQPFKFKTKPTLLRIHTNINVQDTRSQLIKEKCNARKTNRKCISNT